MIKIPNTWKKGQEGSALLEGLFAILIFSMGILAIVGLQYSAVKQSTDAKFRTDASLLANELIGKMWASDRTTATMQAAFSSSRNDSGVVIPSGASYNTWKTKVADTLPGIAGAINAPVVKISGAGLVEITIFWIKPGDSSPHKHVVVTQIQ